LLLPKKKNDVDIVESCDKIVTFENCDAVLTFYDGVVLRVNDACIKA
ncbi:1996_t:CDS:1, partial [Dentiscutata heterogama]